jgi:hypothetical protein
MKLHGASGSPFTSAAAAANTIIVIYVLFETHISRPFSDMYDWLSAWFDRDQNFFSYLWQPHNEHHIVWIRLLVPLDLMLGGRGIAFMWAGLFGLVVLVAVSAAAVRASELPNQTKIEICTLLVTLVFGIAGAVDCSISINVPYPLAVGFGVVSLWLAASAETAARRISAVLAAIAATFASGVAIVLLPVLFLMALRSRWGWHWAGVLALICVCYSAVYVSGNYHNHSLDLRVVDAAAFGLAYFGLPISRDPVLLHAGMVIGGVILVLSLIALSLRRNDPYSRFAQGCILFSLGTAALAVWGRSEFGIPIRYTVFLMPLQIGLIMLGARLISSKGMLAAAIVLLGLNLGLMRPAVTEAREINVALDRIDAGDRDADLSRFVPRADFAAADVIRAKLKAATLSQR